MRKAKAYILLIIFLTFIVNSAFAVRSEFEEIKKLETKEKEKPLESIERPRQDYNAQGLRDPFLEPDIEEKVGEEGAEGPGSAPAALPSLKVYGVVWGGSFPQAIINSKVVRVGDNIEGARVIKIDKEGVVVFFEGKQYNLPSPAGGATPAKKP